MGDDAARAEAQKGRGDEGGRLAAAPGSIRPAQGLLKSRWCKLGRAQVVASMWAPGWINCLAKYLCCRR